MVNQLAKILPNFADITNPLHELLSKKIYFIVVLLNKKLLNSCASRSWAATEQCACERFRNYLIGLPFTIQTSTEHLR